MKLRSVFALVSVFAIAVGTPATGFAQSLQQGGSTAVKPQHTAPKIGRALRGVERQLPLSAMRPLRRHFPDYRLPLEQDAKCARLCESIELNDVETFRRLIDSGFNANWRPPEALPPLFVAIRENRERFVELLIDRGARLNPGQRFGRLGDDLAFNAWGQTPLYFAARLGRFEIVKLLVEGGADLDARNRQYKTAVVGAVEGGHRDVFEWLIEKGAKTEFGSPFYADSRNDLDRPTSRKGQDPSVELPFDEAKREVDWNLLDFAKRSGDRTILSMLKKRHEKWVAEIPLSQTQAMYWAVSRGDDETIEALLELGHKPTHVEHDWNLLHLAAKYGRPDICRMLLEAGMDPNEVSRGSNPAAPIELASQSGSVDTVETLRKYGAKWEPTSEVVVAAMSYGAGEMIRYLLENADELDLPKVIGNAVATMPRGADPQTSNAVKAAGALIDAAAASDLEGLPRRLEWSLAERGQLELLKQLEKKKALNLDDQVLRAALQSGNQRLCEYVRSKGAELKSDPEQDEKLLRFLMVEFRDPDLTEFAFDCGIERRYPAQFDTSKGYSGYQEYGHPLYHAALVGDAAFCKYLIRTFEASELWKPLQHEPYEYDSDIEYFKVGNTPLFAAVYGDHWEVVELFLTHRFEDEQGNNLFRVDDANSNAYTALHEAVNYGASRCAQLLLAFAANPLLKTGPHRNRGGDTCLHLAIHNSRSPHSSDSGVIEPEQAAVFPMLVASAMEKDPSWQKLRNQREDTILHQFAFAGHLSICRSLLDLGAGVNAVNRDGYTPLFSAIYGGGPYFGNRYPSHRSELCRLLIDRGTELTPSEEGVRSNYVELAASSGLFDVCKYLESHGLVPDLERDAGSMLCSAATSNRADFLVALLDRGADINSVGREGKTALHCAIEKENLELFRLLLERGADVNIADRNGRTPLFSVFDRFAVHVGRFLVADPEAARQKRLEMLKILIEAGADIDHKANAGKTVMKQFYNMPAEFKTLITQ